MRWRVYTDAFIMGFSQVANYRLEMWFMVISKVLALIGLGLLWRLILIDSPTAEVKEMAGYLLISNGVRELVDAFNLKFAATIMDDIRDGSLNSALLRPINPYRLGYFSYFGTRGVGIVLSLILLVAGIWVSPPRDLFSIFGFGLSIAMGMVLSYWVNLFSGWLSFWIGAAPNIRSTLVHAIRVFSGAMIPVNYFPGVLAKLVMFTPFPALAYIPAKILQKGWSESFGISLAAAGGWIIIFALMEKVVWKKGLKKYEAVGI